MDVIWDIITLPFELIGESLECLFGCAGFLAIACCILTVFMLVVAN